MPLKRRSARPAATEVGLGVGSGVGVGVGPGVKVVVGSGVGAGVGSSVGVNVASPKVPGDAGRAPPEPDDPQLKTRIAATSATMPTKPSRSVDPTGDELRVRPGCAWFTLDDGRGGGGGGGGGLVSAVPGRVDGRLDPGLPAGAGDGVAGSRSSVRSDLRAESYRARRSRSTNHSRARFSLFERARPSGPARSGWCRFIRDR